MRVTVINGSPKGENSITLQTVLYIEKKNTTAAFSIHHIGSRIRAYEKPASPEFAALLEELQDTDLILFSYPVYTFLVPSQLHRFVELLTAAQAAGRIDLSGKYATQLTTSKHFYDVTAHKFLQENMEDLGLRYVRGLSADMSDLTKKKGQEDALKFFSYVRWCMGNGYDEAGCDDKNCDEKNCDEKGCNEKDCDEKNCDEKNCDVKNCEAKGSPAGSGRRTRDAASSTVKPVMIVSDADADDDVLNSMIRDFRSALTIPSEVIDLRNANIKGGCLGCLKCASTGVCVYKDEYQELLAKAHSGCGIVYAFRIRNHSMGARFKMYDDRQFCNGHRTVTMGTPVGYLIAGEYEKEDNLRMVLEGRAETGGNFYAGAAVSTETSPQLAIGKLAAKFEYAVRNSYAPPSNFLGVGGMKIFRDLIYQMRGFMKADHRFFKEHGQYDFPQKEKGTIALMYLVGAMMSSEKLQKKIGNKMNEGMLAPYKKILEDEN